MAACYDHWSKNIFMKWVPQFKANKSALSCHIFPEIYYSKRRQKILKRLSIQLTFFFSQTKYKHSKPSRKKFSMRLQCLRAMIFEEKIKSVRQYENEEFV